MTVYVNGAIVQGTLTEILDFMRIYNTEPRPTIPYPGAPIYTKPPVKEKRPKGYTGGGS